MIVLASLLVVWIYGLLEESGCPAALLLLLLLASIPSSALSLTDDHNAGH